MDLWSFLPALKIWSRIQFNVLDIHCTLICALLYLYIHVGCFAVVSAAIVQNLPIYLDQISSQKLVMI